MEENPILKQQSTLYEVKTNCHSLDDLLGGKLLPGVITHLYGPGASGKTNVALQIVNNVASQNKNVVFIDTEGGFSFERLKQISKDSFQEVLKKIILLSPVTFDEQAKAVQELEYLLVNNSTISLIVVDSISHLYRLERAEKKVWEANHALSKQIHLLLKLARKYSIPILLTNQVYSLFDAMDDEIQPVAGDILKYSSKVILKLETKGLSLRKATLQKHLFKREGSEATFEITEEGIR